MPAVVYATTGIALDVDVPQGVSLMFPLTGAVFTSGRDYRRGEGDRCLDGGDIPSRAGARRARALCARCLRQRPGERIRCLSCNRRVGPGCTPGCLLAETARAGRQRTGLCADWPHCGSTTPGAWTNAVRDLMFPTTTVRLGPQQDRLAEGVLRGFGGAARHPE